MNQYHPYHEIFLEGQMELQQYAFRTFATYNRDLYSIIDTYLQTSEFRAKVDVGNLLALNDGGKGPLLSINIYKCEKKDANYIEPQKDVINWIADVYSKTQWLYCIASSEIIKRLPAKTLASFYEQYKNISLDDTCVKLYEAFLKDIPQLKVKIYEYVDTVEQEVQSLLPKLVPGVMFEATGGSAHIVDEKGVYQRENNRFVCDTLGQEHFLENIYRILPNGLDSLKMVYNRFQLDYFANNNHLSYHSCDVLVYNLPKIKLLYTYANAKKLDKESLVIISEEENGIKIIENCADKQIFSNTSLNNMDGSFTGNLKDFLISLEENNPNLCCFKNMKLDNHNMLIDGEPTRIYKKNNYLEHFQKEIEIDI